MLIGLGVVVVGVLEDHLVFGTKHVEKKAQVSIWKLGRVLLDLRGTLSSSLGVLLHVLGVVAERVEALVLRLLGENGNIVCGRRDGGVVFVRRVRRERGF